MPPFGAQPLDFVTQSLHVRAEFCASATRFFPQLLSFGDGNDHIIGNGVPRLVVPNPPIQFLCVGDHVAAFSG
jgi:hypothetical protein